MREGFFRSVLFTLGIVCGALGTKFYFDKFAIISSAKNHLSRNAREPNSPTLEESDGDEANETTATSSNNCPPSTPLPAGPLSAPLFKHQGILRSDIKGRIYLAWSASPGAKSYLLDVYDKDDRLVKSLHSRHNVTYLSGLYVNPREPSTPYKLKVTPLGDDGKPGDASDFKEMEMLPLRNLTPPTIKSITTE